MRVRVSTDEGKTWTLANTIEYGWSAYSDTNVTPAGTSLCFYGRSETQNFAGDRLTMARFEIDWPNLDWFLGGTKPNQPHRPSPVASRRSDIRQKRRIDNREIDETNERNPRDF